MKFLRFMDCNVSCIGVPSFVMDGSSGVELRGSFRSVAAQCTL